MASCACLRVPKLFAKLVTEEHGAPLKVSTAPVASASAPLASPPLASPPPENVWQCFIDPQSKYPYYYNTATGESRWEAPPGWGAKHAPAPALPHTAVDLAAAQVRWVHSLWSLR